MLRFLLSDQRPTRLDFLRKCFSSSYSASVTELLVQKLRGSSRNQYESTWKLFLNFLHSTKPHRLTEGVVLEFLTHQFKDRGR